MPTPDPKAKSALLRAAEEVFADRGIARTTIDEIVTRAGASKESFRLYFDGKEAILQAVVEAFLGLCESHFAPPWRYPDLPEDPLELLDFTVERDVRLFDFFWESRTTIRVIAAAQSDHPHFARRFDNEMVQRNHEWLAHWRGARLMREEIDVDLAVTLLSGAYGALTRKMLASKERPPFERWLAFAQETFVRAFGTEELVAAVEKRTRRASFVDEAEAASRSRIR